MSKSDGKNLTLRQIAKLADTSKSTVSRVLTNHPSVSPRTRARIETVIRENEFRPNFFARGLAGGRTGLIAALSRWVQSGFYAEVVRGLDEAVGEQHGHLLISFAHSTEDYIRLWRDLSEGGLVDGIVLIAPPMDLFDEPLHPNYAPSLLCACHPGDAESGWQQVDSVGVNNRDAMEALLQHVYGQGCRRIAYIPGDTAYYDARERRIGFEAFVRSHDDVKGELLEPAHTTEDGQRIAAARLRADARPDAFIAFNDAVAFGVMQAAKQSGARVPEDLIVAGCDDDPVARALELTTLHMPMVELGRSAAARLLQRLSNSSMDALALHETLKMSLEVRASSVRGGEEA